MGEWEHTQSMGGRNLGSNNPERVLREGMGRKLDLHWHYGKAENNMPMYFRSVYTKVSSLQKYLFRFWSKRNSTPRSTNQTSGALNIHVQIQTRELQNKLFRAVASQSPVISPSHLKTPFSLFHQTEIPPSTASVLPLWLLKQTSLQSTQKVCRPGLFWTLGEGIPQERGPFGEWPASSPFPFILREIQLKALSWLWLWKYGIKKEASLKQCCQLLWLHCKSHDIYCFSLSLSFWTHDSVRISAFFLFFFKVRF